MKELAGKTALITGATGGIGSEIAQVLAAAGANIVLNGFAGPDEIDALVQDLQARHGVDVLYDGADLSRLDEIEAMCEAARRRFGVVDVLVNNAGIQHVSAIHDFPVDKWDKIIAINLSAVFHTIRLLLPEMMERRWGRIVNIASTHGLVASPTKGPYVAAKHGVVGLTKTAALEAAPYGVTVNAVAPGYVRTVLVERQIEALARDEAIALDAAAEKFLNQKHASGQFATTGHIAAAVTYLCSEGAASTTGVTLPVDGGWTAQ